MKLNKGRVFFFVFALLLLLCVSASADVKISKKYFPDHHFREVVRTYDTNQDGTLDDEEIQAVRTIDCEGKGIASLKGVEWFSGLEALYCKDNKLTSLNLNKNQKLWILHCENNQLTTLNVTKLPNLSTLYCSGNKLTALNLTKNRKMEWLRCEENRISEMDLSHCPGIVYVICYNNNMKTLKLKNNNKLDCFYAYGNVYETLDFSTCRCLDWAVKHGTKEGSCNYTGWVADDVPEEISSSGSVLVYVPSGTRVITAVDVTKISLNKKKAALTCTEENPEPTLQLTARIHPSNATNQNVSWKSSNKKVATVDRNGKVTAHAKGKATITCTAKDGSGTKATCKITVKAGASRAVRRKEFMFLKADKDFQLRLRSFQAAAAEKEIAAASR